MIQRTYIILRSYPTGTSEFWSGLVSVAWGAYILTHGDKIFLSLAYLDFIKFMPRTVWGTTLFVFGLVQLYAMDRLKPGLRMAAAILLTFAWSFVALFAFISAGSVICLPFFAFLALEEFWITIRASPPPHIDLPFAPKREEDLGEPS